MTNSMFPTEAEYAAALKAVEGVAHRLRYMASVDTEFAEGKLPAGFRCEEMDRRVAWATSNERADYEFSQLTLRGLELLEQGADGYHISYDEMCDGVWATDMILYKLTLIPKE